MRRLGIALLGLAVLFLWWNMVRRATAGPGSQYDDFVGFARDLLFHRENLYRTYPAWNTIVKYPPFFAFVYAPLVALPERLGASIWFWTSLACSAGAAVASALAAGGTVEEIRRRPSLVGVPYLLIAGVVISNLETAQVNLFLLFFWTVALMLLDRGREGAAGALIGYVTAVKLSPGIFVPYFLWMRRWRGALAAVAVVALCWTVVTMAGLGFDLEHYADVMRGWVASVSPFVSEGGVAEGPGGFRHTNQSLSAAVHRFLTATPADGRELYVNVVALDPAAARIIVLAITAALLGALAWATFDLRVGGPRGGDALRRAFGYALVMSATLFLSPVSWINHYVLLLFPFAAAWRYVATRPADDRGRRLLVRCLPVSVVLVATGISRFLMAFSLPFLGAIVLFAGMAIVLRRDLAAAPPAIRI